MGEDLADVVAAAAEDGEKRVAKGAFEEAASEAAVRLHVTDLGLDAAASAQRLRQRRCKAAAGSADQDLGVLDSVTFVAAIDDCTFGRMARHNRDLLQHLAKGVAIVGIARQGPHPDDEALLQRGGDADLAAELVAQPSLGLRDAVHLGFVERLDLAEILRPPVQQARDQHQLVEHPLAQRPLGDLVELPTDVPHHAAGVPLQRFLADSLAPPDERGRVDRWLVLKEGLAGEVLELRFSTQRATTATSDSRNACWR